ncbi:4849_t:CDS:2, partial [Ambispora gerdemannii]
AKLKLQAAQVAERYHQPNLLKKVKNYSHLMADLRSLDTLILQQEVEAAKVKLLAAENAQQISQQLKLQTGCEGCEYTKSLFAADKVKPLQKDLENIQLEAAALAVYNTQLSEQEVIKLETDLRQATLAQTRIERLAEIQSQREKLNDYQQMAALETLEKAAYWWQTDKETWQEYDSALRQLENIRNLEKELTLISQKLVASQSSLAELIHGENEARQKETQFISLRKLGLEKVIAATKNVATVKETIKTRTKRQQLKSELPQLENKLATCQKWILSQEAELTDLRLQRDQTVGIIASLDAEVGRLSQALVEETQRVHLLTETQEKINLITTYRKILDPKTGIADRLLKRSRAYLEAAVNSVLGECGASFRLHINEELELNTTTNNPSVPASKILLAATLGSAEVPLPDCQFIDEGFGTCDETNLEAIIHYLVASTTAPNRAGKSALIDIIIFALYDEYPRAERKLNIINKQTTPDYYLRLDFELDGKKGYIEKKGKKNHNKHDAHCKLVYDNQELTQGTNTLTCQAIIKLVGTYSNAQLTAILQQTPGADFVQLKPSERKQALARLLALGSFEQLAQEIYEEYLELRGKLSTHQDNFAGKEVSELRTERQMAITKGEQVRQQAQVLDNKLVGKEKELRDFRAEKEQVAINLARLRDKITNLGPENSTSLGQAEAELKKTLKITPLDKELSAEEEYRTYFFQPTVNSSPNIGGDLAIIPTRSQVLEIIQQTKLVQEKKQAQEPAILATIVHWDGQKSRLTTLLETTRQSLLENHPKLAIDMEKMKVAVPAQERPKAPAEEEILAAQKLLASLTAEKDSARTIILQNLAIISNNLVPPVQDEKVGEYDNLLASSVSDHELVA